MQRLKTWAQFQAVLAGATIARSEHFALHRKALDNGRPQDGLPKKTAGENISTVGLEASTVDQRALRGVEAAKRSGSATSRLLFPSQDLWLGAMVPKRWAKRAATRNAIKRQIYAVSAEFSPKHREAAFVVRLRRDFSRQAFPSANSEPLKQAVRQELLALLYEGAHRS